jgi:hypothetical protein
MGGQVTVAIVRALLLAAVTVGIVGRQATAETLIEHSAESRFQLDFHVPDAALQNALPAGWEPVIATAGPAKDANLRLIFVDRVGITGADGKPLGPGTNRMAILAIPVKQTATGITGQMIIGGLTEDPADAPGPFGVYLPAAVHRMERSCKVGAGSGIAGEETWDFQAAGGEHLAVHVTYERGRPSALAVKQGFSPAPTRMSIRLSGSSRVSTSCGMRRSMSATAFASSATPCPAANLRRCSTVPSVC